MRISTLVPKIRFGLVVRVGRVDTTRIKQRIMERGSSMTMATTSLAAYQTVKVSHNEEIVLDVIRRHEPVTNQSIAKILGWSESRVTGRTNGLCYKNLIRVLDLDGKTESGKRAKRWVVINPGDKQLKMFY